MDRIIYTAMNGAARTLEQQSVISNNMANANTTGFREQFAIYRAVPIVGDGSLGTRISTVANTPGFNATLGSVNLTGRSTDVALEGEGWLAVQTPQGEAYTRNGALVVGANGLLQNSRGQPVLSADNAVIAVPEGAELTIAGDGTITALGAGDPPADIQQIGQLKLVNPPAAELVRGDDGLFRRPAVNGQPAPPLPQDPLVRVISGGLEGSNVNTVESMVGMIDNARRYEMQMKVISSASENASRANGILSASQ
ncbi:Flagellar basal-body rod protein FlgF [plant metagenome]|uniref:Flagellar basal-body rod protein FlgF n=1 Tax=plant metagenome TaxID=1297885 RepID=A0A484PBC1_9ZZZZ